jgi:hypothetical protein
MEHIVMGTGPLFEFIEKCKTMTSFERAKYLETCNELAICHETNSLQGQTEAPNPDDEVNLHFSIKI